MAIRINSAEVYSTGEKGFASAIQFGNLVFTSGQVGWDINHRLTGSGSFLEQLEQAFKNCKNLIETAGCALEDVIMIRFYVKDLNPSKRIAVNQILTKYYANTQKPATTLLGVECLARKDILVEIEMIAGKAEPA